jgi:hypothetical protein
MKGIQFQFLWKIVLISAIVFGLHLFILSSLEIPLFKNKIVLAYVLNVGVALLIFNALYIFREKFKSQLGYLFLFGTAIKFIVFFLFFNSAYKADGIISKQEFAAFFVPYAVTLIVEVYSLIKWLNKLE